ncbi:hypothetical protein NFJ02_02g74500 [Pycnococcus provasolii]
MSQNPSVDSHPGPGAADSHVLHCPVCLEKTLKQTLEEVVPSLQQKIEQVERNRKGLQERLSKRIVEAKQDITRLKKEVDEETAKQLEARQQHESFMRQSAEERERARLDVEETTSKLADLKRTNESMKAQIDELARLKVAREEELRNYRAQVESIENTEQVERNRKGLQEQERLAKRVVEAKQDTTRLKKEVDEETAKQLEARQQHESFMRQSAEERERARLDIEETTSKLADLKRTNESMKAQIDELARLKVAREEELRNYRAQVESYESDRGGILARCKELGREGDVLAVRRNSLQLEYDGLLSSLKSLQEHHDSAKAAYDELDASTATLTDDLNARRRERDAASEDFVALHEEVVSTRQATITLHQGIEHEKALTVEQNAKIAELQIDNRRLATELHERQEVNYDIRTLVDRWGHVRSRAEQLKAETRDAKAELRAGKAELASLSSEVASVRKNVKKATAARERSMRDLAEARTALAQTRKHNAVESERITRSLLEQCTKDAASIQAALKTSLSTGAMLRKAETTCAEMGAKLFERGLDAAVRASAEGSSGAQAAVPESATTMPDWQVSRLASYENLVANGLGATRTSKRATRPASATSGRSTVMSHVVPPHSAAADAAERARRLMEREARQLKLLNEIHATHAAELKSLAEACKAGLKAERDLVAELHHQMRDEYRRDGEDAQGEARDGDNLRAAWAL